MSLANYQTTVTDLVRDRDQVISDAQRDAVIGAAVTAYSLDRPRAVVVDVTSAGGQRIDLPAGFTDLSRLVMIEHPIGHVPTREILLSEVNIYSAPVVRQIDLPVWTEPGDTLRITYTAEHILDADQDTIPPAHAQAVACLAAAMLCGHLSSYYAGESEPTISADTVNRQTKSATWRTRQRDLSAEYGRVVGPAPSDRRQGASATKALKRDNALGGRRMFHPTTSWPVN